MGSYKQVALIAAGVILGLLVKEKVVDRILNKL